MQHTMQLTKMSYSPTHHCNHHHHNQ